MPATGSRTRPNVTLTTLVLTFAVIATVLWLLPFFANHSVLFPAGPTFADILVYKGRFTLYHSAKFFTSRAFSAFAYPAGSAPIYEALYKTSNPVQTYCLIVAFATIVALLVTFRCLHRAKATNLFLPLLITAGFPLVFLIQRGNIEVVLWILVAAGVLAYIRGLPILAAVLFGVASATKLYPIFMLGLLLGPATERERRDLTAFAVGLFTALLSMLMAIAYAGPTFAIAARGFFSGVNHFQDHYVDTVTRIEVLYDHCLYSPVKYWAFINHASPAPYTHLYLVLAGSFALSLFLRVRTLPLLNRVIFLTVSMVALPPVSFNYTLVHLYLPLVLLLCALASKRLPATALAALALLLFVMLPLVSLSMLYPFPVGLIQAAALLGLMLLSTLTGWPTAPQTAAP